MIRISVLLLCMVSVSPAFGDSGDAVDPAGARAAMDTVAARMRTQLMQTSARYRRYSRRSGGTARSWDERIRGYLEEQRKDGSWPGIEYADRSRTHWAPSRHTRILSGLAGAYREPGGELAGDVTLRKAILSGLDYWVKEDPRSKNWWFNCINTPRDLGRLLLLMGDEVPEPLLRGAENIIRRSSFKRTGANLIWEAGNLLVLACVIRDAELFAACADTITSELRVTTEEGVQEDFSFHQHGPQLYMSNYGQVFSSSNSEYARLFAGTAFALSPEKIRVLSGLVLEGQQWFAWGRQFDYHALGRQLDTPSATWSARRLSGICSRMAEADHANSEAYRNFGARVRGEQEPGETGPRGNRHFWRSDIMVHRPGGFYVSVRMHSTRTQPTEVRVNRENLKGYHLSDGAYFPMRRGDEYHSIQPVWDWRKLPGVTFKDTDEPLPYGRQARRFGNTDFVGGVSDGLVGVAAMDYDKEDVKARKAWFFFDAGWVCLGAGISSETDPHVTTSVSQCLLKSEVRVLAGGEVSTLDGGDLATEKLKGVHHDSVGYYFLGAHSTVLRAGSQTGTWTSIEERSSRKDPVTQDVFSLWVDHGPRASGASYAYVVMPGTPDTAFESTAEGLPVKVLSNTPEKQVVSLPGRRTIQAVLYEAGALELPDGGVLRAASPCLVMAQKTDGGLALSAADPTQKLGELQMTVTGRYGGEGCTYSAESGETTVAVPLPTGASAGKTVRVSLKRQ